jgi:hypothetical protein
MTYKGIIRGNLIELANSVGLSDGTVVEVIVNASPEEALASRGDPKGSSGALLAAWERPPYCTAEDVATLLEVIEQGKRPMRFASIFDLPSPTP